MPAGASHRWIVWAESQGGDATRLDLRSGKRTRLEPLPAEGTRSYRFNWDSPLALDRFDPAVAYLAGNRIFKYTKEGEHWTIISPDLSKDRQGTTDTAGSSAEKMVPYIAPSDSPA